MIQLDNPDGTRGAQQIFERKATEGVDVRSGGKAKLKRGRYAPLLVWVVGIFAFPLTLFTHATLSRRIGFAWARIDWGHGTLCLIAVALLQRAVTRTPAPS